MQTKSAAKLSKRQHLQGDKETRLNFIKITALFIGLFASLLAWGFSSPVGSSPDDDFHLASIWCGKGEQAGICQKGEKATSREVPLAIAESICFAYNSNRPADCQNFSLNSTSELYETERLNSSFTYPPVFYWTLSHFVTDNFEISILVMRIFNSLLFTALLFLAYLILSPQLRKSLIVTYGLVLVPLGFFLIASTNPSSWGIMGIGVLFLCIYGLSKEKKTSKIVQLSILAAFSFLLLVGSRGDTTFYALLAVGAAVYLSFPQNPLKWLKILLSASMIVIAVFAIFLSSQSTTALDGLDTNNPGQVGVELGKVFSNVLNIPSLILGIFGYWGLGWLDTPMPIVVWVGAFSVFIIFMFMGFGNTEFRKNIAAGIVFMGILIIPLWILFQSNATVGSYVQPRYIYPLVILLASIILSTGLEKIVLNMSQKTILFSFLFISNSVALHINLDRYISGLEDATWNFSNIYWWWEGFLHPGALWSLGVLAGGLFFWSMLSLLDNQTKQIEVSL